LSAFAGFCWEALLGTAMSDLRLAAFFMQQFFKKDPHGNLVIVVGFFSYLVWARCH
jgi:hypothetical protein